MFCIPLLFWILNVPDCLPHLSCTYVPFITSGELYCHKCFLLTRERYMHFADLFRSIYSIYFLSDLQKTTLRTDEPGENGISHLICQFCSCKRKGNNSFSHNSILLKSTAHLIQNFFVAILGEGGQKFTWSIM